MLDADAILDRFEAAGYRLTEPRRAVAALVGERTSHFTAEELLVAARDQGAGLSRATLFRSLETLATLGVIERLDLPTGEHAFVACRPAHHHHVVCSRCGRSSELVDTGLLSMLDAAGRRSGYRIDSHRLEVFGVCPTCQAEVGKRPRYDRDPIPRAGAGG